VATISKMGQANVYQSRGRHILYYPITQGLSEVCREWIMCQTSKCAGQYIWMRTEQQSHPLCHSFKSCPLSLHPYDLSSDDEEYFRSRTVPDITPGRSDGISRLSTAARLYLNLHPESPQNLKKINSNLTEYHSDPIEISS
jgi:hypothetical protein